MLKRVKNILGAFPFIGRSQAQKGTISTIRKAASAFVKRRKQLGGAKSVMPVKKAMGGEASEGVARAGIRKGIRDRKRKELMDSLERLRKKGPRIKPKKKPEKQRTNPRCKILNLDLGTASSDQIKSAIQTLQDRLKENK